jgi:hypothetical protein
MDKVFHGFLRRQLEQGPALGRASDVLDVVAFEPSAAPQHYVARFRCTGLVRAANGEIVTANDFLVGVFFPDDYLRNANPAQVLTWLGPQNAYHPNISASGPFICVGRLAPGTALVDILYQVFEIITYQKATMREDDALNRDACAWARRNLDRLPIDPRPLKRRAIDFTVAPMEEAQ